MLFAPSQYSIHASLITFFDSYICRRSAAVFIHFIGESMNAILMKTIVHGKKNIFCEFVNDNESYIRYRIILFEKKENSSADLFID